MYVMGRIHVTPAAIHCLFGNDCGTHQPRARAQNENDLAPKRIRLPFENTLQPAWTKLCNRLDEFLFYRTFCFPSHAGTPGSWYIPGKSFLPRYPGSWYIPENGASEDEDTGNIPESFYTNGGLKLRVVWTISSLIAASARHYLLQNIISEHPTLENLILTDSDQQGVLCMNRSQLQEFRDKPLSASASSNGTQVPALNMKLWYAPCLELPCGMVLKGATLVSIRPCEYPICKETDGFLAGSFEGPFKTAASLLSKRRTYLLEMNSF